MSKKSLFGLIGAICAIVAGGLTIIFSIVVMATWAQIGFGFGSGAVYGTYGFIAVMAAAVVILSAFFCWKRKLGLAIAALVLLCLLSLVLGIFVAVAFNAWTLIAMFACIAAIVLYIVFFCVKDEKKVAAPAAQ